MSRILRNSPTIHNSRTLTRVAEGGVHDYNGNDAAVSPSGKISREELINLFSDDIAILKREASDQGYADGLTKAQLKFEKELENSRQELEKEWKDKIKSAEATVRKFGKLVESALSRQEELVASQQSTAIFLALEMVYKLVGDREVYREIVVRSIKEQVNEFVEKSFVRLRISPADSEVEEMLPDAVKRKVRIVKDPLLESGCCEIEDGVSLIDVGVVTKLDRLRESLVNTYKELNHERL